MKNFKRRRLSNTFTKLLSSYLIIISVILSLSSVAFYVSYKRILVKQGSENSSTLLQQANYYTNFNFNWAKSLLYSLYLDEGVHTLLYSYNQKDTLSALSKIDNIRNFSPYIDSVYIYNKNNNSFYSSEPNLASKSKYEYVLRNILKTNNETFTNDFIANKIEVSSNNRTISKNIFSIVLSNVKSTKDSLPHGALILNIDANELSKYFKQSHDISKNLFAINNDGQIILSSDSNDFLKDISDKPYVKRILNSSDKKGNFITSINNATFLVTYISSENNNVKFINIVPYKQLMGEIREKVKYLFLLALILFLIGIIPSYFMSNKIYTPINRIMEQVESTSAFDDILKNNNCKNELEYLSAAIDYIASKPSYIDELSLDELVFIRKIVLKDLLKNRTSSITSKNDISIFDKLNINIDKSNLIAIIFKIDFIDDFYRDYSSKDDRNLIRFRLKNIINDSLSSDFLTESLIEENLIISIISFDEQPYNSFLPQNLIENIENIQNNTKPNLNVSVSASIGDCINNLNDLFKSFDSAKKYMRYTFKYGSSSILYNKKILRDVSYKYNYDEKLESSLYESIKLGNLDKLQLSLDNLFMQISNYSYDDMILAITNLFIKSEKVINDLCSIYNEADAIETKDYLDNLKNFQSISSVKEFLFELYKEVIESLNLKKLNKTNALINDVKEYIDTNFADTSLSIPEIADKFSISPNYLRSIFKNTTGVSLSKYINNCKFEKAQELLINTDLTINDIAIKVGYVNTNYFFTAFKKMYGISPAQYRNINKK
ncbi:AraC family transcriptional regulator [Clostridium brassicae]|uniref:AraC family transcriptional regulator n=1 Tax=Clostridium brassicae TaxID=2999072 RepID=A0ABT4D5C8_9CLOT|nr:AraC family transcriptional regulator [Clostridium brassicae]MCY6957490.1 AraC family transcriptional regulator [Clostridium brassicae]